MAKYRCPVCGATHREMPEMCRLCGQLMGENSVVGDFSGNIQTAVQRKGLGGIVFLVILGVVALVVGLALAGVGPGAKQIDTVVNKVGLKPRATGWTELRDEEGKFSTDFPSNDQKQDKDYTSPFSSNKATRWSVNLSGDTIVEVQYVKLDGAGTTTTAAGSQGSTKTAPALLRIREIGAEYKTFLESNGAKVSSMVDDGPFGYPAQYIEARRVQSSEIPGKDLNMKAYIFVRGDTLFLVASESVFGLDKMEAFDNLRQNFILF